MPETIFTEERVVLSTRLPVSCRTMTATIANGLVSFDCDGGDDITGRLREVTDIIQLRHLLDEVISHMSAKKKKE